MPTVEHVGRLAQDHGRRGAPPAQDDPQGGPRRSAGAAGLIARTAGRGRRPRGLPARRPLPLHAPGTRRGPSPPGSPPPPSSTASPRSSSASSATSSPTTWARSASTTRASSSARSTLVTPAPARPRPPGAPAQRPGPDPRRVRGLHRARARAPLQGLAPHRRLHRDQPDRGPGRHRREHRPLRGQEPALEDTLLKANLDAVREIVRQIRLRDLGGHHRGGLHRHGGAQEPEGGAARPRAGAAPRPLARRRSSP